MNDTPPPPVSNWRFPKRSLAVGFILAVLVLGFPVILLLSATAQYAMFPGCYGGGTTFSSGEHLGFRVGMNRAQAAAQMLALHSKAVAQGDLWVMWGEGRGQAKYADSDFPQTASAILAIRDSKQTWVIDRPGSLCLMSVKRTMLEFRGDRLTSIRDDLSYSGI